MKMKKRFEVEIIMIIVLFVLVVSLVLMLMMQECKIIFALSSNIVAGYIFYVVISFIPRKLKERKSLKILQPQLNELKLTLSGLLAVVEGFINVDKDDKVNFPIEKEYFITNYDYKSKSKYIWREKISDYIIKTSQEVQDGLEKITGSPLFRDLNENIAESIVLLWTSKFFSHSLNSVAKYTKHEQETIGVVGFKKSLEDTIAKYHKIFHEQPVKARKANFDEINVYNNRIELNRQMYKDGKKICSFMDGVGVQEL